MTASRRIWVGARGWTHRGWNASFYPEDLPADWRLDYYFNEFGALLLPAGALAGLSEEEWASLAGFDPAAVRLFLECPPGLVPDQLESWAGWRRCRAEGVRLSGLLWPGSSEHGAAWQPMQADARRLPVFVESDGEVRAAGVAVGAGDALVLLTGSADLRTRRRQIAAVLEAGSGEVYLLLDGESPSVAHLRALAELASLMASF